MLSKRFVYIEEKDELHSSLSSALRSLGSRNRKNLEKTLLFNMSNLPNLKRFLNYTVYYVVPTLEEERAVWWRDRSCRQKRCE